MLWRCQWEQADWNRRHIACFSVHKDPPYFVNYVLHCAWRQRWCQFISGFCKTLKPDYLNLSYPMNYIMWDKLLCKNLFRKCLTLSNYETVLLKHQWIIFFEGRHFSVLDDRDFTATFYINLLNAANYSSIIHTIVIMITG